MNVFLFIDNNLFYCFFNRFYRFEFVSYCLFCKKIIENNLEFFLEPTVSLLHFSFHFFNHNLEYSSQFDFKNSLKNNSNTRNKILPKNQSQNKIKNTKTENNISPCNICCF